MLSENVIKSISFDQQEILENIFKLHCGSRQITLDMTFGHGGFYKNGIPKPLIGVEINPALAQKHKAVCADCTALPIASETQNLVMLDGPFGIASGASLDKKIKGQNITPGRFGCFSSGVKLFDFYTKAITEAHRVLEHKGILIQKIQGTVACAKQHMTHIHSVNVARELGFYFLDEFVLMAKARPISGKIKKQQHARKYHCFFLVFRKDS